jgi:hypothetical protein
MLHRYEDGPLDVGNAARDRDQEIANRPAATTEGPARRRTRATEVHPVSCQPRHAAQDPLDSVREHLTTRPRYAGQSRGAPASGG